MSVVVTVAVPVPALPALSYRVPDGMAVPPVGGRVRVPLGQRVVSGCVVADGDTRSPAAPEQLRDLLASLDPEPYLPRDVVDLALWVGGVLRLLARVNPWPRQCLHSRCRRPGEATGSGRSGWPALHPPVATRF